MNIKGLLKKAVSVLVMLASLAYSHPVREKRSSNTVEFFMKKTLHDQINWYGTDQSLDSIREKSERAFGYLGQCPATVKTGADLPVSAKSTCPWYYKVDHNPNRYPANILYAVTPCTDTCIGGNDNLQCLPVVRTVETMIESGEDTGNIKYETKEEQITVGFTCGARYMAENVPATTASPPADEPIWDAR